MRPGNGWCGCDRERGGRRQRGREGERERWGEGEIDGVSGAVGRMEGRREGKREGERRETSTPTAQCRPFTQRIQQDQHHESGTT